MNRRSFIKSIPALAGLFAFLNIVPKHEEEVEIKFDTAFLKKLSDEEKISRINNQLVLHPEHVKYLQEIEEGRRFLSGINWVETEYIT